MINKAKNSIVVLGGSKFIDAIMTMGSFKVEMYYLTPGI